jgi:hypothetical protein
MHHIPTEEEKCKIRCGDFSGTTGSGTLASRGRNTPSDQNRFRARNEQPSMEENKSGGVVMDFSGAFTGGAGASSSRPPLQNKSKVPPRPQLGNRKPINHQSTKPQQNRNAFGTPIVKTTRAMQLRREANKDKHNVQNQSRMGRLETVREHS